MIRSGADAEKIAKQTAFIRSILPASKVSLLDNYVAALKDTRKVPDVPLKNWQDATLAQLLREAAEDQSITHVGILSGDDMSRWATGRAGTLKEDKVTQGLRIHANNYMPSRLEKIAKQLGVKELKLEKVPLLDSMNVDQQMEELDELLARGLRQTDIEHALMSGPERRHQALGDLGFDQVNVDERRLAAQQELKRLHQPPPRRKPTATVIRMTPELRRALLKKKGGALPLMSVAGPLAGATAAAGGAAALRQALNPPREEGT